MAIETMACVRMAVHKSISDELIDKIQRLGCCQFIPQSREKVDERDAASLRSRLHHVEDLLGEARFVMRFLEPYASLKGGGLSGALGDLPSYSIGELEEFASEDKFRSTAKLTHDFEKRSADAKSGISRINGLRAQIMPIKGLPYSLDFYTKGTDAVQGALYSISSAQSEKFESDVARALGDMAELYALPAGASDPSRIYSLICSRERANALQEVLAAFQVSRIDVPAQLTGLPADELANLEHELSLYKQADDEVTKEIKEMADEACQSCQYCTDYWNILRAKLSALIEGDQTEQIIVTSFWIPQNCMEALRKVTAPYEGLTEVAAVTPEDNIEAPTLLKNSNFSSAIEPLITMYGIPTYGGFDPTTVVTPFFYLFFGMCFGDAGYGLVIAGLLLFLMMKRRITGTLKKFLVILTVGNVMAVVVGALTFSWFGDSLTSFAFLHPIAPAFQKLQILDPMKDPMTMLYISLALGFIQIMTGLVIAMRENLRKGDKMAAFSDQGGWIVFLCGLVLVGLSGAGVIGLTVKASAVIAGVGAIILVATQGREKESVIGKLFSGIMSLYNVTGYLGDVLSYSRLLALGLGSAAVGMVINLLANLVAGSIPGIGIVLGLLIFVLGHLFGIAVNMLGAFIHSLRLQYVEFFGKFHEASGVEFVPLAARTQYVRLTESADA
ncbi:MAG: V-type ATP synthase subunit I [Synergistaceae bacterium]|jgi:V/A-type H+-transporting ATPase subunit I|nr:V-type ATP synthase subunit I [Synergistaceae bacterium]